MDIVPNLNRFFDNLFEDLSCHENTRSYIIGIFDKYKTSAYDLSNESITLKYAKAKDNHDFVGYQMVGDYLFFTKAIHSEHLKSASEDYYRNIGRLSYYSCYRILNNKWPLFEELSDRFIDLESQVKDRLKKL